MASEQIKHLIYPNLANLSAELSRADMKYIAANSLNKFKIVLLCTIIMLEIARPAIPLKSCNKVARQKNRELSNKFRIYASFSMVMELNKSSWITICDWNGNKLRYSNRPVDFRRAA